MVIEETVNGILEMIRATGAWGVIIGILIESIIAPIPSPIIVMAAGFIMLPATLSFFEILPQLIFLIVIPGAFATTIGSYIGYGIGYYGGKPLIKKFEWLLGVSWDDLESGVKSFGKGSSDEITVLTARAVPIIPLSVFSAVAGVVRLKFKVFTIYTFIGAMIRIFILGLLGWMFGGIYESIAMDIESLERLGYMILAGAGLIIFYLLYNKRKKRFKEETSNIE